MQASDTVETGVNRPILRPMSTKSPASPALTDPQTLLDASFRRALEAAFGEQGRGVDPAIRPSQNPTFGDYQANFAMGLAKQVGANPREIATKVVAALDVSDIAEAPEVAGPGFVNIRLKPNALADMLIALDAPALGVESQADLAPVVVDLCSVNVAKQMHVGHLRSTIIGDSIARAYERQGRRVIRQNHLGDWGVPIAMVLHQLRAKKVDLDRLQLADLERAYRDAQLETRGDERGLEAAKNLLGGPHRLIELEEQNAGAAEALAQAKTTLVKLQRGDAELVRDWQKLIDCTMTAVYEVIGVLGVDLSEKHQCGESFYRDRLADVIEQFEKTRAAEVNDGALIVRFDDRERPLLIRKSDGGYLYSTTDLAAVRYRVQELGASRIIYVVDSRQRDHFQDVFDAARKIGWTKHADGTEADLIHLAFGSVLGKDKRPLKTRSSANIPLKALLEEAIERGTAEVAKRAADPNAPTHGLSDEQLRAIGRAVGIGAVKYADLSNDLIRDYVFDFDRMIAFEGNTGPYMQYAHARICSIFAKAEVDRGSIATAPFMLNEPAEKGLALLLMRYPNVIRAMSDSLEPHRLCAYLYDLANAFSAFYQACPVLKAEDEAVRASRLHLCDLTRRVLADGLSILGIDAPERM